MAFLTEDTMQNLSVVNAHHRGLGWNGRRLPSPFMGQNVNPATATGRVNLSQMATGLAMVGGGAWALTSMPGFRGKTATQIALGTLGGGLLIAGLLNFVSVLSSEAPPTATV
jgi:hypothetical protein